MEINIESLQTREDWLRFFAKLWLEAQKMLISDDFHHLTGSWLEISQRFFAEAYPPVPLASRKDYDRWLNILIEWADQKNQYPPVEESESA